MRGKEERVQRGKISEHTRDEMRERGAHIGFHCDSSTELDPFVSSPMIFRSI
jgi:hypothetical protein